MLRYTYYIDSVRWGFHTISKYTHNIMATIDMCYGGNVVGKIFELISHHGGCFSNVNMYAGVFLAEETACAKVQRGE